MKLFEVRLDVSGLEAVSWEAWCEADSIEGVEFLGAQGHGPGGDCELWCVTAPSKAAARTLVEAHLVDGVTIQSVKAAK